MSLPIAPSTDAEAASLARLSDLGHQSCMAALDALLMTLEGARPTRTLVTEVREIADHSLVVAEDLLLSLDLGR